MRRGAVIIDTETTDLNGIAIEVGVVDLRTGRVLMDTLVRTDVPISEEASAIHGIGAADLQDAPQFGDIATELRHLLADRPILAYNAPFDHAVLARTAAHSGIPAIAEQRQWACVMRARSRYEGGARWRRLNSNHRAVGDCVKTRTIVSAIASSAPTEHIQ